MQNGKIDLVVMWVDGSDEEWLRERAQYSDPSVDKCDNDSSRYRDFDLMQFFFRGVEENMPWINKVFFVTWGHLPKFLNKDNPKLRIVRHDEYIPKEYLPTYNSSVIELNLHRIEDLSENFILFNDDMFVIDKVREDQFFKNDLPCDTLCSRTMVNYVFGHMIYYMVFNDMGVINKHFYGNKPFSKWINPHYSLRNNIGNLLGKCGGRYSAFEDHHLPTPHKKSVFKKIWEEEYELLDKMCHNRFRTPYDFNQWMMRYWNFASGNFVPSDVSKLGFYTDLDYDIEYLLDLIENRKEKIFLLNDTSNETFEQFEAHKPMLHEAFSKILPNKSSYEL
jgi:hypothetical protein